MVLLRLKRERRRKKHSPVNIGTKPRSLTLPHLIPSVTLILRSTETPSNCPLLHTRGHLNGGGAGVGAIVGLSRRSVGLLMNDTRLTHDQAERSRVDLVVAKEKQETETRLGQNVENAIKDGLRVRVYHISTFRQAPYDSQRVRTENITCRG